MLFNLRSFDEKAGALTFPLGGIGTGTVSLGARGNFRDWEIFNRPAKGTHMQNTYFLLRIKQEGEKPVGRVLEAMHQPPYDLSHGFDPQTGAGLPHFPSTTFHGEYPFARVDFHDDDLPIKVHLEAFTPLIPLDPENSGIPCAIFTYHVTNTGDKPLEVTVSGSLFNPVGHPSFDPTAGHRQHQIGKTINYYKDENGLRGVYMTNNDIAPDALEFGSVAIATSAAQTTAKPTLMRSGWWDFLRDYWTDLLEDGRLTDLGYTDPGEYPDTGAISIYDTLAPGQTAAMRFVITWYFPNRINSWDKWDSPHIRNHYATRFTDAWDVARDVLTRQVHLEAETRRFHQSIFDSTLPAPIIDAISANIVPLRSNTCFWLENDHFFAWEGCADDVGSCYGTCTHVWSYAYTVAYLFPSLERRMRNIEFNVETDPDGFMAFRNMRLFDPTPQWVIQNDRNAAVDGQMGTILRAYREWLLSGDLDWLRSIWPNLKNALKYAGIRWDKDNDRLLEGQQHNTYDIDFWGPNPLGSIYYLAALRATAEMARLLGEAELAQTCDAAFARSSQLVEERLWNGEFYIQHLDDVNAYRYQHGLGCLSDQVLGQAHAHFLGLGDLLPRDHIVSALRAIFRYNFRRGFRHHVNTQRTFVLGDESGLLLCTWPNGGEPRFPFPYSDEVWTGIEYHVAAHLIALGCWDEGLTLVQTVRDRHDGVRRSPWNEVECGHHYARSMASWMLLLATTGLRVNPAARELHFNPVMPAGQNSFKSFWSNGQAWGSLAVEGTDARIEVLGGTLEGWQIWVNDHQIAV